MRPRRFPPLAVLCAALAWPGGPAPAAGKLADGIAAQVGNDIVLVSEVRELAAPMVAQMQKAGVSQLEIAKLNANVLERLIERRLIQNVVRRAELEADDREVDTAIEAIAKENGLTPAQLRRSVESHDLTFEAYRNRLKEEIERTRVINLMVRSRVHVDDVNVRGLYEQRYGDQPQSGEEVHLRQLVVPYGPEMPFTKETACGIVEDIEGRIGSGEETFEELARRFSAVNAEQGGDIGWIHSAMLSDWMTEQVSRLEPGQMSELIVQPFGCNLLKLVERREFKPVAFAEAETGLKRELHAEKMQDEYQEWMEKLRKDTYVERKGIFADAAQITRSGNSDSLPTLP